MKSSVKHYFCLAVVLGCLLMTFACVSWGADSLIKEDDDAVKTKNTPLADRQIQGPIDIKADRLEYDHEKDTYYASGNVVINFTDGFLFAENVVVNKTTGDTEASGHVYISDQGDTLEGDKVRFNLNTKTGLTLNGKAFLAENHVYLTGATIEKKGPQTYFLKDATVTTCDSHKSPWKFTARELDVTVEGYGTLKGGTFQVNDWPIVYAPYMVFPAKTKRQTGLLPPTGVSYSDTNGFDMEVPFFWAISEDMDATFYQRVMSKRGWKEGVEFRYYPSRDTFGTWYGDFLSDGKEVTGAEDGLYRDWTGTHNRWSYFGNHQTTFSSGFYLRMDLAKVSDHWYFRDFSNNNYYLQNYSKDESMKFQHVSFLGDQSLAALDSTARIVKDWSLYNLTILTRYTDNLSTASNDATLQYYPQITFTGIRQPLFGTPLNFDLASSYLYAYRNEGQKGHVVEVAPTLSLPVSFGDYLQLTPSVGFTETAWEAKGGGEDNNHGRSLYTLGLYTATEVERIFPVRIGSIEKIKHAIRPEITYAYRPNVTQNVPDFVPVLSEMNALTYALSNYLTAKIKQGGDYRYIEFLRFKVSQTYNITEVRDPDPQKDRRRFSGVDVEADVLPGQYVSLRSEMTYDPNNGAWKRFNHDISLKDDRGDSASIGYRYTQDQLKSLNLNLKTRVSRKIDLLYLLRKNLYEDKTLEQAFGLDYKQQCWSALLSYSELDNDRRIMVTFTLLGIGKIGQVEAKPASVFGRSGNESN